MAEFPLERARLQVGAFLPQGLEEPTQEKPWMGNEPSTVDNETVEEIQADLRKEQQSVEKVTQALVNLRVPTQHQEGFATVRASASQQQATGAAFGSIRVGSIRVPPGGTGPACVPWHQATPDQQAWALGLEEYRVRCADAAAEADATQQADKGKGKMGDGKDSFKEEKASATDAVAKSTSDVGRSA